MATLETGLVHRASNHFVSLTARSQKSLKIPVQDRQKHILDFFNFTGVCSSGLVLTPPSMTTKALEPLLQASIVVSLVLAIVAAGVDVVVTVALERHGRSQRFIQVAAHVRII